MSDTELHDRTVDALRTDPRLDSSRIEVVVRSGAVSLNGRVCSYAEKVMALRIVSLLPGVREVEEDLGVSYPLHSRLTDDEIASRTKPLLRLAPASLPAIGIAVRRGWVTLKGCVSTRLQADLAEAAVEGVPGVIGVNNLLTIGSAGPVPAGSDIAAGLSAFREKTMQARRTAGPAGDFEPAVPDGRRPDVRPVKPNRSPLLAKVPATPPAADQVETTRPSVR
jgi:osmotically-inducible protein OsmY